MTKVEKLIREVSGLPKADRVRLLEEVERSLEGGAAATRPGSASYAPLISLARRAPSDFGDVSTEKYRHLADIFVARGPGLG